MIGMEINKNGPWNSSSNCRGRVQQSEFNKLSMYISCTPSFDTIRLRNVTQSIRLVVQRKAELGDVPP